MSLDVIRGEVEAIGKAHQNNAQKIKSELEEPLAAFAGAMKERRKIVQGGIEKLLKVKTQQTMSVNKTRDRYEQDSLKIKGYLAQGHMVMGQEERKNKAKLEKTQIQLSSTSNEYEAAVKVLEETTGRWNRDWKAACDKFQDLEEERVDFMKSSLWTLANVLSEVCVSDDAACEKMRLSLEECDVEKDIAGFIREMGTGQEIPDAPKFIDFCRGDVDTASIASQEEESYAVAQFQRAMNPAFRASSPQPSTFESHHDPHSQLARDMGHEETGRQSRSQSRMANQPQFVPDQLGDIPTIPHNEDPPHGMTQFCRIPPPSDRSSQASPVRPGSRDSHSDYSNPTSFSSVEPTSPVKFNGSGVSTASSNSRVEEEAHQKKRSSFFQSSPFRRRSKHEKEAPPVAQQPSTRPASRQTWGREGGRRALFGGGKNAADASASPEPVDPRANFQLNVGNNVFDVASPDAAKNNPATPTTAKKHGAYDPSDPIAAALEELKGVTKQSSTRVTADRYHGLSTPAPPATPGAGATAAPTPPPAYNQPGQQVSRLGAPQPAFTSKAMQQTTQRYVNQAADVFGSGPGRPGTSSAHQRAQSRPGTRGGDIPRATSPAPMRATSPRPGMYEQQQARAPSPNPYGGGPGQGQRPRAQSTSPVKPRGGSYNAQHGYASQGSSPNQQRQGPGYGNNMPPRAISPSPYGGNQGAQSRPGSSRGDMALQLAPNSDGNTNYGSMRGRGGEGRPRPMSQYYGNSSGGQETVALANRTRSKSVAGEQRQYTPEGRAILHYGKQILSTAP